MKKKTQMPQEYMKRLEKCSCFPWMEERTPNVKRGKANKYIRLGSAVLILLLPFILFFFFHITAEAFAGLCAIWFIVFIAVILKNFQFGAMDRLTVYFSDENGFIFKVTLTKGASVAGSLNYTDERGVESKSAQVMLDMENTRNKAMIFSYVERYKRGIKDWNFWTGGEAKVKALPDLRLERSGKRKDDYSYIHGSDRKNIRISGNYRGLRETVKHQSDENNWLGQAEN